MWCIVVLKPPPASLLKLTSNLRAALAESCSAHTVTLSASVAFTRSSLCLSLSLYVELVQLLHHRAKITPPSSPSPSPFLLLLFPQEACLTAALSPPLTVDSLTVCSAKTLSNLVKLTRLIGMTCSQQCDCFECSQHSCLRARRPDLYLFPSVVESQWKALSLSFPLSMSGLNPWRRRSKATRSCCSSWSPFCRWSSSSYVMHYTHKSWIQATVHFWCCWLKCYRWWHP